jgi:hypothetical protein
MTAGAPVRRGKRTALVSRPPVEASAVAAVYVCTAKALDFGQFTLTKDVEVPGAAGWTRLDSWVGARRIRKLEHGEGFTSFLEFAGGICESLLPEQARNAERTLPDPE